MELLGGQLLVGSPLLACVGLGPSGPGAGLSLRNMHPLGPHSPPRTSTPPCQ